MINLKTGNVPATSFGLTKHIITDQGLKTLWRGNMPKIWHNSV